MNDPVSPCGERFFIHGDDSPGNTCQKTKGHDGAHLTGVSEIEQPKMLMRIAFGEKTNDGAVFIRGTQAALE